MLRKRRAMNRPIDAFKTHESSTRNIVSGSRASRIIRRLGLTSADRTQNDSVVRTVVDGEAPAVGDFHRLESMESQKPDPTIWTTVERVDADAPDIGSSEIKPGMKKTVWNVRK
jgi:hypothetical protein